MTKTMSELTQIIEGALFAASEPLSAEALTKIFMDEAKPSLAQVRKCLAQLQENYQDKGIRLVEVATGYRFQVAQEVVPYLTKNMAEKPTRFSRAMLETLALIAYRQPITRGEIEEIRGVVASSNIIKTLEEFEWIRIVGHKDVPGKPGLYATTKTFLDHFGLKSLDELPPLAELKDINSWPQEPITVQSLEVPQEEEALETTENALVGPSLPQHPPEIIELAEESDAIAEEIGAPDLNEAAEALAQEFTVNEALAELELMEDAALSPSEEHKPTQQEPDASFAQLNEEALTDEV